ncbi:DUF676-domain-containing protein [Hortaea werneckii]|uniref:DUF676 domain-containing protein n=1 Tax=Hortaea werneckii TaxID=91943 RepID=A0A3M7FXM1_HORWE|nr:DUF676-domain-containing protein [Hortaea werneckii]KAI7622552.1 DUF676-domain-containing protein [Hortaea werneckii]KAI7632861.1 DUF676-domain-containing protein [Hortaea werneckii]KAI7678839.1 DUF676-domain-containing protein [Hortaea werneckii]KAI7713646.1 DUF676-domain-containing protein [Hortaea werneckii]
MAPEEHEPRDQDPHSITHLVILTHGLWGNPVHLHHLRDTLLEHRAESGLHVFIPQSNKEYFTYDGIDVGAERITTEIEDEIRRLQNRGAPLSKISIAGYSLGGLIARYVVGLLYKNGVFETLQPCNFTTFATPHLGVRTPGVGYGPQTWNFLGSKTLSTSGQQMFLTDDFRDTGRPLLAVMADPTSIFIKGLAGFQRRTIYANTTNDRSVPYYTSAISSTDPFADLDAIDVHPLPDQEHPVVLDPTHPVSPRKQPEVPKPLTFRERYIVTDKTKAALPFYAVLAGVLPLAVPLFMVNAGYQTYKSAQRVRLHEQGDLVDLQRYRIPFLEESQAVQDRMVERLATESSGQTVAAGAGAGKREEYLPTPPPEEEAVNPPATTDNADTSPTTLKPAPPSSDPTTTAASSSSSSSSPFSPLALSDLQFQMITNLDRHIAFTKFPVHIQNVRHTHAAIVVRTARESFAEGKMVSAHWVRGFVV